MPKPAAQPALLVEVLPLSGIEESPFNPRKTFADLEELAEDVKRRGVLQPVLVRPLERGMYQLVFGARRYRAAKLAGLQSIPAMVRELGDAEALEIALVENAKRSDVHPLEEADAYRELHTKHGYDVETIAAKVGRSKASVYQRLKLVELGEVGRKAFFAGRLTAATALLFARIGDPATQDGAVEELLKQWDEEEPIPFQEVVWHVQQRFTQDLEHAPFDTTDNTLLGSAGACTSCPKRSGANPDLFSDIKKKDVCTDTACFRTKVANAAERKRREAEAAGHQVLEEKEAKKALSYASPYVKLSDRCYDHPQQKTWAQLLKKADIERVVAIAEDGAAHELVRAKDAKAALADAGEEWAKGIRTPGARAGAEDSYLAEQRKREQEIRIKRAARRRAIELVVANVQDLIEWDRPLWEVLLSAALQFGWSDTLKAVADRRELLEKKSGQDVAGILRKHAQTLTDRELPALVLELAITREAFGGRDLVTVAGEPFDVNLKELVKLERAIAKEKKKAKASPAKKKAGKAVAA